MANRTLRHLIVATLAFGFAATAQAQATRTWVSGVGDDVNPCSRTAPCKTFAGAISKTAAGGEISALDPAGFGAVTITKSITINGDGTLAGVLASGSNGITINATAADTIVLRNLSINGATTGVNGIRVLAAGNVYIDRVTVTGFDQRCISIEPSTDLNFVIKDTVLSNCVDPVNGGAILVKPTVAGEAHGILENVVMSQSTYGVRVEDRATVTANDSEAVNNLNNGFLAISNAASATLNLENCVASSNRNIAGTAAGVQANGAGATVNLSNTAVFDNSIGLLSQNGGDLVSFGNNRQTGNDTNNAPTLTISEQ